MNLLNFRLFIHEIGGSEGGNEGTGEQEAESSQFGELSINK
jgi:hypothetical protein